MSVEGTPFQRSCVFLFQGYVPMWCPARSGRVGCGVICSGGGGGGGGGGVGGRGGGWGGGDGGGGGDGDGGGGGGGDGAIQRMLIGRTDVDPPPLPKAIITRFQTAKQNTQKHTPPPSPPPPPPGVEVS